MQDALKVVLRYLMLSLFTLSLCVIMPILTISVYIREQNGFFAICFLWFLMVATNVHYLSQGVKYEGGKTCSKKSVG